LEKFSNRELAEFLLNAELERKEVVRITKDKVPDLTVEEAYLIQEEIVKLKLAQGHKIVGPKMGLTSRAKMKQMGVEEPIYGYVFNNMMIEDGSKISLSDFIHPKVEAEIAFILGKDIHGPSISGAQVIAATEYVIPALEIIDSRYENFNFTLPDVVADNASTSKVVFGNKLTKPQGLELDLIGTTLTINGEIRDLGAGAAILGHPANAIAMLANMLHRKGEHLKAGQIILAGAITSAIRLSYGDYVVGKLDGLGEVTFSVGE